MPDTKKITDFDFAGYRLLDFKLSCPRNRRIDSIILKASEFALDDKGVLSFHLHFNVKGNDNLELLSVFECVYKVNEPIEINPEDEFFRAAINNMSFIALPYIRTAIMSLTNDSASSIMIPTFDLSKIDFVGGTKFERTEAKPQ